MFVGVEQLPEGRTEDAFGVDDGETEVVGIHNLVGVFVDADFAANTANADKIGNEGFFDHEEVLGKTAQGYIHILMGLAEYIHGHAVVAVVFKPLDGVLREVFIVAGVEVYASFVND